MRLSRLSAVAGIAAVVVGATTVVITTAAAAGGGLATAGPGPCVGAACPSPYPQVSPKQSSGFAGRDEAINVFVGRSFTATGYAAEAEGRLVVGGDFTLDKTGGELGYDVGVVGLGSQVPPPEGADFLTVGGSLGIARDNTLRTQDNGVVRYAGARTGAGAVEPAPVHDSGAFSPYSGISAGLRSTSTCYAAKPSNGTVTQDELSTRFTGDGHSALQVFTVPGSIAAPDGGMQGIDFADVPDGATILINMVGTAPHVTTWSGSPNGRDQIDQYGQRMLWNFPNADSVALDGASEFQGSVLVPNADSTTLVTVPGFSGRFFTAGSAVHGSSSVGSGNEFHAYPFTGAVAGCEAAAPSTTTDSTTTTMTTTTGPAVTTTAGPVTTMTTGGTTTGGTTPGSTTSEAATGTTTAPVVGTTTTDAVTPTTTTGGTTTTGPPTGTTTGAAPSAPTGEEGAPTTTTEAVGTTTSAPELTTAPVPSTAAPTTTTAPVATTSAIVPPPTAPAPVPAPITTTTSPTTTSPTTLTTTPPAAPGTTTTGVAPTSTTGVVGPTSTSNPVAPTSGGAVPTTTGGPTTTIGGPTTTSAVGPTTTTGRRPLVGRPVPNRPVPGAPTTTSEYFVTAPGLPEEDVWVPGAPEPGDDPERDAPERDAPERDAPGQSVPGAADPTGPIGSTSTGSTTTTGEARADGWGGSVPGGGGTGGFGGAGGLARTGGPLPLFLCVGVLVMIGGVALVAISRTHRE
ncbi:choice-of-anchor A family protein [Actinosynnema mirum]|uniref:choice-of-anchor A family protein n=1 Tax=Actinosynnema mirum TaxID=40567 RepID=UPI0009FD1CDC|nr:choice-of-anchor A family protein [Actinosynnema mirum]